MQAIENSADDRRLHKIRRLLTKNSLPFSNYLSIYWYNTAASENATFSLQNFTTPARNSSQDQYFDYEFAFDVGILAIPDEVRQKHNFEIVNVTMSGSRCFGGATATALLPVGGIDTVVVNNVMKTVNKPGILVSKAGDYYTWQEKDITPYTTILGWIGFKLSVLTMSLLCFFLLSTSTALLVRVLISSGVVLLFPVFWAMQVSYFLNSCQKSANWSTSNHFTALPVSAHVWSQCHQRSYHPSIVPLDR